MADNEKDTTYGEMIKHFESLRSDLHEDRMVQSQRIERTEEKIINAETAINVNRAFVEDVKRHMLDWERKIPELIHGSVIQCTESFKKDFKEHVAPENTNPHPKMPKPRPSYLQVVILVGTLIGISVGIIGSINPLKQDIAALKQTDIEIKYDLSKHIEAANGNQDALNH